MMAANHARRNKSLRLGSGTLLAVVKEQETLRAGKGRGRLLG